MAALSLAYDGHRATITLTQPEVRNAFSDEVIADITAAFLEVGARAAHRYFLTAERFDAAEALRIGFVHAVVVAEQLDAQVDTLAQALSVASPQAVRACKKLVIDVAEREIDASLIAATVEGIADIRASAEGREGVQSFLQKRKPNWL